MHSPDCGSEVTYAELHNMHPCAVLLEFGGHSYYVDVVSVAVDPFCDSTCFLETNLLVEFDCDAVRGEDVEDQNFQPSFLREFCECLHEGGAKSVPAVALAYTNSQVSRVTSLL